ncbi:CPBP family glutamic-type intramembrane protease [Paenibacillus sp. DMB20]|uniref:CPBP family glutamic-type intramembrane protease n=1 Tax=Paenibacillus sp. DMB20 TaxID=1642570 RepID=UPI00069A05A7|nr:CPBP family glutamic-type intramembrane protease [Paenibacillus sp. DMB20]
MVALLGWVSMVIGLFTATWTGHLIEEVGGPDWTAAMTKCVLVSLIVIAAVNWIRRRYPIDKLLPLTKAAMVQLLIGAGFPVVLAACGFLLAIQFEWIDIVEWHFSFQFVTAVAVNTGMAFLYEALPEELTMRGLVYSGLRTKFHYVGAYVGQVLLFIGVPVTVNFLQQMAGMEPGVDINTDYVILLFAFGTVLQLLRNITGSLWTSIGFHLGYLEISRFVVAQNVPHLVTYTERYEEIGNLFILFGMVILGGIFVAGLFHLRQRMSRVIRKQ